MLKRGNYHKNALIFILSAFVALSIPNLVDALPYINFSDGMPSFVRSSPSALANNSFIGGSAFQFNVSFSTSSATGENFFNISNISFYLQNSTGTYLIFRNTTTNGTLINGSGGANSIYLYTFTNDTTVINPGNYNITIQAFQYNTTNGSFIPLPIREENMTIGNITIVNADPTVTINTPVNSNLPTVRINFTAIHAAVLNQDLRCNITSGPAATLFQDQTNVTNGSAYVFANETSSLQDGNKTYTVTCTDLARTSNGGIVNTGTANSWFNLDRDAFNFTNSMPSFLMNHSTSLGNNSFIGGSAFTFNVTLSTSSSRTSISNSANFYNVSNVTFFLRNSTGSVTLLAINTTANGTLISGAGGPNSVYLYTFTNDTTSLTDEIYNITIMVIMLNTTSIHTENLTITNVTIINANPTVTINSPGAVTNTSASSIAVNFSVFHAAVTNQTFTCNFTIASKFISELSNITNITNSTHVFANQTAFGDVKNGNTIVTCIDQARTSNSGPVNSGSASVTLSIDTTNPQLNIQFRDKNNNAQTTFDFGEEVTIDCNPSDATAGIDTVRINATVLRPNDATVTNLTAISKVNQTLGEVKFTGTAELGDYNVTCVSTDFLGLTNMTTKKFTINTKIETGTSAFASPGFSAPVGKKKVSEGVTSNLGVPPTEGVSRLLAKGSTVIVNIKNEDHKVTVLEITDDSLKVKVSSSDPMEVTIAKGETEEIDLDNDGVNDLAITYHKRFPAGGKWADVTLKVTSTEAKESSPAPESKGEEETTNGEEGKVSASSGPMIVTVLVIAVIIIVGYFMIRGKR